MKKLLNDPGRFAEEAAQGILLAHQDQLVGVDGTRGVIRRGAGSGSHVALATGGGSGHLPLFLGYVGKGMLDGAAVGGVFNSPSADAMMSVTRAIHQGAGVLYIYGNYGGDVMNFDLASELAGFEDIEVRTVVAADDVASAPYGQEVRRRGVAGIVLLFKVAGAAADLGWNLADVEAVTVRAASGLRTMGVALSSCIVPAVGVATFEISDGEMEIGMGLHGEPGVRRGPLASADDVADELVDALLEDLPDHTIERVAVMVNGLGATPYEELYIIFRRVHSRLADRGIRVAKTYVGQYATALEMAGASVSILPVDDGLLSLLDHPASTPFFTEVGNS